jgi:Na+/proline symporter
MGEYCGVAVSTMITVGILGAFVSSMPGFFLSTGALITRDIFLRIKPKASEKAQLTFARIIIPMIVFSSTYFALFQPSILGLYLKISQVRAVLGFIVLITIVWRRIHSIAAYWTIIIGGTVGMIWFLAGSPFGIEPLWPGLGIGILILVITSLRNRPSPFKGAEGLELD